MDRFWKQIKPPEMGRRSSRKTAAASRVGGAACGFDRNVDPLIVWKTPPEMAGFWWAESPWRVLSGIELRTLAPRRIPPKQAALGADPVDSPRPSPEATPRSPRRVSSATRGHSGEPTAVVGATGEPPAELGGAVCGFDRNVDPLIVWKTPSEMAELRTLAPRRIPPKQAAPEADPRPPPPRPRLRTRRPSPTLAPTHAPTHAPTLAMTLALTLAPTLDDPCPSK
ncbi:hypothetical protein PAPYR_5782 [Paratrimastix pyriformis]|uniref:Uncharacterized protein n=1 Tax=Paratrimastix pyriformis TaxID=342808 RepID=A0ABQ8UGM3_9EUKA|nr:hypothetical protein PAPYR_5782 [Paratrimastix pyriformis]